MALGDELERDRAEPDGTAAEVLAKAIGIEIRKKITGDVERTMPQR